jgi:transcriptional regulator with XRE-family HTH domain
MTLRQYRLSLGWSLAELARRSGLTYQTVSRIEKGEAAFPHTIGAIARALSEGLGKTITIEDIEGVKISE